MTEEQRKQLQVVVAATVNGDKEISRQAFNQYLTQKLADAISQARAQ